MKYIEMDVETIMKYQWVSIRAHSKFQKVNQIAMNLKLDDGSLRFNIKECVYLENLSENVISCSRRAANYLIEFYRIKEKAEVYGSGHSTSVIINSLLIAAINEIAFGVQSFVRYMKKIGIDVVKEHKKLGIHEHYGELKELRNRLQHRDNNNNDDKYLFIDYFDDNDPFVKNDGRPFVERYNENPFKALYGEPTKLIFKEMGVHKTVKNQVDLIGEVVYENVDSLVVWGLQFIDIELHHFDQIFGNA